MNALMPSLHHFGHYAANMSSYPSPSPSPLPPQPVQQVSELVGYASVCVSVLFFGSNLLPIKQFETGDGMLYQFVFAAAIWVVGFVVFCVQSFPKFYVLPMLGGFFW